MKTTLAAGRLQRIGQACPFDLEWSFQTLLEQLYAQHGGYRAYHNLRHLEEMTAAFVAVRDRVGWRNPEDVFAALLMHDVVLNQGQTDNELRSAEFARELLPALLSRSHLTRLKLGHVTSLIRLTAQHGRIDRQGLDHDARHFLDCDMVILGAEQQRFLEYDADVAREYEDFPLEDYRRGRRGFLEWLVRPEQRIFLSDFFHGLLEERAKANLRVALERL